MSRRLLISALPGERRCALVIDDKLQDLVIERADRPSLLGNCYLGRVHQVDKALDAAFLDIGLDLAAFLPLGEAPGRKLSEGDLVPLRVLSEPSGTKGPKVSARLSQAQQDMFSHRKRSSPGLVRTSGDPLITLLQQGELLDDIVCDEPALLTELKNTLAEHKPGLADRLRLYREPEPLFEGNGIEAEIEALLEPRVALPGGGHLLIEPTETLVAIDVNSGSTNQPGGPQAMARRVNAEAVPEVARQLRLRALGGLIVIDFLPIRNAEARKKLMIDIKSALRNDPEPFRIVGMTASGLLEMNRRRGRPALHDLLTVPLHTAVSVGTARRIDPVNLAFQAIRRLRNEALRTPGKRPGLRCALDVSGALSKEVAEARKQVEAELGAVIELCTAPDCPTYEILLR